MLPCDFNIKTEFLGLGIRSVKSVYFSWILYENILYVHLERFTMAAIAHRAIVCFQADPPRSSRMRL